MLQTTPYNNVILDIEGTICPISFVKEELFPYFLKQLPSYLNKYDFPLNPEDPSNDVIQTILTHFNASVYQSRKTLLEHVNELVRRDIKDPVLKQLQGFIWEKGYTTGSILAPLFADAIEAIKLWSLVCDGLYIYSSGSVKAQKLLFANVKIINRDGKVESAQMNDLIDDYFDTVNIGHKIDVKSYVKILQKIGVDPENIEETKSCLFLSDNPLEVKAAIGAGMSSFIVQKPGNYPLTEEDKNDYAIVNDFHTLFG